MKNKIYSIFIVFLLMTFTSCKSPLKKKKDNVSNSAPPTCEQTQSCHGSGSNQNPIPDPLEPDPIDPEVSLFSPISSTPSDGNNTVHVDEKIIVEFNKNIDPSAFGVDFISSGTSLDLIQLKDQSGTAVQIRVDSSSNKLLITPSYSLIPNTRYNLTITTELTAIDGVTLNAPFYLTFYTDSEIGINPGTEIEFSWGRVPNPDGRGGSYFYEDEGYGEEGYGDYRLHYGLKSFPRGMPENKRLYSHNHNFNSSAQTFYTDYELERYYYTTELNLLKQRTYYFALDVCNQSYCTEKSDELGIFIE